MGEPIITVANLSKRYRIGAKERGIKTLHEVITEAFTAPIRNFNRLRKLTKFDDGEISRTNSNPVSRAGRPADNNIIWALKDVSFEVRQGEILGIIGRNGAGKSTLLKILSRITEPTTGDVKIYGRVSSLLEVGTGFHPELTGRENIFLNGAILGMRKQEIKKKFDEIVAFAETEKFIDTPVKRYSSGMYVRLAFSVAAHLDPEILIIDEVLSVGDLAFQRKCMEYAKRLQKNNSTVLLVSHNMFTVKAMCNRVLYLSEGQVRLDGSIEKAMSLYEQEMRLSSLRVNGAIGSESPQWPIHITDLELQDVEGRPRKIFDYGERMRVRLRFKAFERIINPNFIVAFIRSDKVNCCNYTTATDGFTIESVNAEGAIELLTPPLKLVSELYNIQVLVRDMAFQHLYCFQELGTFHMRDDLLSTDFGVFYEGAEWSWLTIK